MITVKLEGIEEALKTFDPVNVRRAARASIDRVARSGGVVVGEEIRKNYNVKKADISRRIDIKPPRMDDLRAVLTISGRPMSLSYFGAQQIMGRLRMFRKNDAIAKGRLTKSQRAAGPLPAGVLSQIVPGRTTISRHAFLAKMKSGHIGVMYRIKGTKMRGSKKEAIAEVNVVTIPSMAENARVMPPVLKRIQERWAVEFPRQLDYYMSRRGR